MMKAVTGHKGGTGFNTHVVGLRGAFLAVHTGVNAIMAAAKLIEWANEMNDRKHAPQARRPGRDVRSALYHLPCRA